MANDVVQLGAYQVKKGQSSVSGLSSGAFMTVQLHLAHSASFAGAGIIAGGPYRCAQAYRQGAIYAQDAYAQGALYICMSPLTERTAPDAERLAQLARDTAAQGLIDDVDHIVNQRIYIFTGSEDRVVASMVVARTRRFYELLGARDILYDDTQPAGHAIITRNPEDSQLPLNQPPYINQGSFWQSHAILDHIYGRLKPASAQLTGSFVRFDQTEFFAGEPRASMSPYGYAYVPRAVAEGAPARVHIALHGCKQGYAYVDYVNGRPDQGNNPPYGNRYFTTTGYNELADANNIIVLYPQAEGVDDGRTQNPDGCWDWWGYSGSDPQAPDYYSRDAIQIKAIHGMLERLGG
ncbi:poly(3-hydroxybutyrate) depolymerase [Ramlibacter sp. G-1-2-2]|uniref:Poly(3-hydroxybutyrate) depolymerase n=1 Tax=Ramlibacter agri TaxID=2728837 RepID=A0A848H8J9_9BURK|nr:poly(3-hydroxybutyrate) depolymerase [Ramlibacter agri]NML46834.1 poly(3-hydroxybutyrate) depolymerase [Ramlibacter agri]